MSSTQGLRKWVNNAARMPFLFFLALVCLVSIARLSTSIRFCSEQDFLTICVAIVAIIVAIVSFWYKRLDDLYDKQRNKSNTESLEETEILDLTIKHLSAWVQKMVRVIIAVAAIVSIMSMVDCENLLFIEIRAGLFVTLVAYFFCYCYFFLDYSLETTIFGNFQKQVEHYQRQQRFLKKMCELTGKVENITQERVIANQMSALKNKGLFESTDANEYSRLKELSRKLEDSKDIRVLDNDFNAISGLLKNLAE